MISLRRDADQRLFRHLHDQLFPVRNGVIPALQAPVPGPALLEFVEASGVHDQMCPHPHCTVVPVEVIGVHVGEAYEAEKREHGVIDGVGDSPLLERAVGAHAYLVRVLVVAHDKIQSIV